MRGGLKIQRYVHDHGLPAGLLSGAHTREPVDAVHVLLPRQGRRRLVVCRPSIAHRFTDRPVHLAACALRSRRFPDRLNPGTVWPNAQRLA